MVTFVKKPDDEGKFPICGTGSVRFSENRTESYKSCRERSKKMNRWRKKRLVALLTAVIFLCSAVPSAANDGGSEYAEALKADDGSAVLTVFEQNGVEGDAQKIKEYSLTQLDQIAEHDAAYGYEYMKNGSWAVWATSVCAPLETILSDCSISFNDGDQIIVEAGDGFSYTLTSEVYQEAINFYPSVTEEDLTNMDNEVTVPCVVGICWDGATTVRGTDNAAAIRDALVESSYYSGSLRLFLGSKSDDFYQAGSSGGREASSTVAGNRSVNGVASITVIHDSSYDYLIEYMSREDKPYQNFYLKSGATIPVPDTHPNVPEEVGSERDYEFDYWYRLENGEEIRYEPDVTVTENWRFYPKWKKKDNGTSGSGSSGGNSGSGSSGNPGGSSATIKYDVTIEDTEQGKIVSSAQKAAKGETVTLEAVANDGWSISSVSVQEKDGTEVKVQAGNAGKYTFTMPAGSVTVKAVFIQNPVKYDVTLPASVAGGSVTADKEKAAAGETVALTVTPDQGYEVESLSVTGKDGASVGLTDQGKGTSSFTMPEGSVEVNLTFRKTGSDDPAGTNEEADCPSKKFTDLDTALWYHAAVDFVLNHIYFNGVSDTRFEPDDSMTRAMFVTVLSRIEGIDAAQYTGSDFSDVSEGQWYSAAVQWASRGGIVQGTGEGVFDPDGKVTREQMAAIMYRYAKFKNMDISGADAAKFNGFTDKSGVSAWAEEALIWATDTGIINGMGDGTLAPGNGSTRAQVAQIVKNYCDRAA